MKFGVRKRSIKKSVKAYTVGKYKRRVKRAVNPLYGKKNINAIKDPKKWAYHKVYRKTSIGMPATYLSEQRSKSGSKTAPQPKIEIQAVEPVEREASLLGWFKSLSTGWKIVLIVLALAALCSIPYVLSGQYDRDQAKEQGITGEE